MTNVLRFEVSPRPGHADPVADALLRDTAAAGIPVGAVRTSAVYLVQAGGTLTAHEIHAIQGSLLADPVVERARQGAAPVEPGESVIEVHPLPGVMDPAAQSVQEAIRELTGVSVHVTTARRYDLKGKRAPIDHELAAAIAQRFLANPVIQKVHHAPFHPESFPVVKSHEHAVRSIEIVDLDDAQLNVLSRDAHLFLSLDEMKAIQQQFRVLGRNPTEIELETLAQTWSEHCVHKTLKATVAYRSQGAGTDPITWTGRAGHDVLPDGSILIHNLLKQTVAAATFELMRRGADWLLSVFVDNAGVIAFDEQNAVCIKVETHNHPSAIEPYGGAATGAGGCIRDVIGTGLGARPIANTDVFCVAYPDAQDVPAGCLPPRRILTQVVAGVRDYGNRMGIPTVNGAVAFDERYVGNPLVFCGCIGVMPRNRVKGEVHRGDLIVALGGRTGRDGIHGATFSSAELEQSSADEFSHAVQIGNAIEEKRVLDAIMRARDEFPHPLYHGLTDCGAGGFSSAVGEMGKHTGATVHLERAPLKYPGLSSTEIWISEAQERMVLAVPEANLEALRKICAEESVELSVLGDFAPPAHPQSVDSPDLALFHHGREVGRLPMKFLHDGIPMPRRDAVWHAKPAPSKPAGSGKPIDASLRELLAHPTIASKHWIIRQYDHEVKGATVIKPLVGPRGRGPSDASVIMPVAGSWRGLAIACGLQNGFGDPALGGDPYLMVLAAIDECVRNLVCVGADPSRIAILDNFCWPSCKKPENLGTLVRAAVACYDGAIAYGTPFVSGKDSLNNQFTTQDGRTIEIPPTLLVTGIGIVPDVRSCVTSDAKRAGNALVLAGPASKGVGGSILAKINGLGGEIPRVDLKAGPAAAAAVAGLIRKGRVASAHDCSEGGVLVAVAEMLIGAMGDGETLGAHVRAAADVTEGWAFGEGPSRYVLEVSREHLAEVSAALAPTGCEVIGELNLSGSLRAGSSEMGVQDLERTWRGTLDW